MGQRRLLADALEAEQKPVLEKKRQIDAIEARLSELLSEQAKDRAEVPTDPVQIAELERHIALLETRRDAERAGLHAAQKRFDLTKGSLVENPKELLDDQLTLARFREKLEVAEDQLKDARDRLAKLKGTTAKGLTECIELTVSGQGGEYEFVIREVPVDPKGITKRGTGPVTTRDPAMLAKLLMRAKNDPNGPQQVVLVAQPQTTITTGPRAALRACEVAGYKTVKFTGYVFGGGEATPLKPDQTGNVPGYKRYNAAEVKPADLVKEIEDGMRRF